MDFTKNRFGVAIIVILLLAGVFYAGFSYGKAQIPSEFLVEGVANKNVGQPTDVDFSLFWDAWRTVEEKFVGRAEIDKQAMVFGAIEGMVSALDDPYTVFFPPEEAKVFQEDVSGRFEGIGAEIGIREDILTIISPLKGSPAESAGLRAGDKILMIDGESTEGISITAAVQQIRGPKGEPVVFVVFRDDDRLEITVIRDTIRVPVIEWEMKGDIGYINLFSFSEEAINAFRGAVNEIVSHNPSGVVLDLRNNPGGFLGVAQEVAGYFVGSGEVVAIEDFGDGRDERLYRAFGKNAFQNVKTVVLINEGSASASEIVAGALRDIRGIKLVGAKSFGKGSIQELEGLAQGASLKVTVARWLTPGRTSISLEGLEVDFEVEITDEDILEERDPQLEKALEVVLQ